MEKLRYKRHLYPDSEEVASKRYRQLHGRLDAQTEEELVDSSQPAASSPADSVVPQLSQSHNGTEKEPPNDESADASDEDASSSSNAAAPANSSYSSNSPISSPSSEHVDYNQAEQDEGGDQTAPFDKLRKYLDEHSHTNLETTMSVGEILLLVLTLALRHNFSLTATCDLMEVLNVTFNTHAFPDNQYKFKKLLNPCHGMKIHVVCEFCGHYIGVKGEIVDGICSICNSQNDLAGYKYESTFITLDVCSQIREVLEKPHVKILDNTGINNAGIYSDISDGSEYRKSMNSHQEASIARIKLSGTFNSDGAVVSRDQRTAVTPVYIMLNELDIQSRQKHHILLGLWYGKQKPRMDVFLTPFVDILNDLSVNGVDITVSGGKKKVTITSICCCVDTVARAPMQGIKAVAGYNSCSWCEVKGEQVEGTMKFPYQLPEPQPRTEETFKRCVENLQDTAAPAMLGVQSASPLNNLNGFNMVWGFTPDYMHAVLLGTTKRITEKWLTDVGQPYYIGTERLINVIDSRIKKIRVPHFLKRLPVAIEMRKAMKAKEWENWLLFLSVPTLNDILPQKYIRHWKLLVSASMLLLQDSITCDDINAAELMLLEFVFKIEHLYGKYEMTHNSHQLLHFAESARRWGPVWAHTAFPFESQIGDLKNILKACKGIPHQIVRQLELRMAVAAICEHLPNISNDVASFCDVTSKEYAKKNLKCFSGETVFGSAIAFESHHEFGLPPCNAYKKVVRNGVLYTKCDKSVTRFDSMHVELVCGGYAVLKNVLVTIESKECYAILKKLNTTSIEGLSSMKLVSNMSNEFATKFCNVKCVAVYIEVCQQKFISSVPHKHFLMNM